MSAVLADICYVRSGDKGDVCTAGLIARTPDHYKTLTRSVTPEAVKSLFGSWVLGEVTCYPMDNLHSVVVVMKNALGGGATKTLRLDQTGKALGYALLRLPAIDAV
jgi:hypothetical protein